MKFTWWKILCIVLLFFTFTAGFLVKVPYIGNLHETIRNFYFHVPMWFGQITLLSLSLGYSIAFLRSENIKHDIYAAEFAKTGIVFGILGLATGSIWATYTWGEPWSNDPKQVAAAIALAPAEGGGGLPVGRLGGRRQDGFHARQQSLGALEELVELVRHPVRNGSRR